jgi:hypothetical protein
MRSFLGWEGCFGETTRRETVRSTPQLEALEERALLAHAHVSATVSHPGAGLLQSTLVSTNTPSVASLGVQTIISNRDVQPFFNTVLSNAVARELANRHALPLLFDFVGQRAGEPGYIPFLDRNRDGVITRSEVSVLVKAYLPPHHLLRVS